MKDLQDGSPLLSVANPGTHVRVFMSKQNPNSYQQIVPLDFLDKVFGWHYGLFIKTFLELSTEAEKIKGVTSPEGRGEVSVEPLWNNWQKNRGEKASICFNPIPGISETLLVIFLGDAYVFSIQGEGSGIGGGILRRTLFACAESLAKDYHQDEEVVPTPSDVFLLFSLPLVDVDRRVVVDCGLLTSAIKNAFGIKVAPGKLAKDLSREFLRGGEHTTLAETIDTKDVFVQCTLTAHHVFSKNEAEDYEKRNNHSLDECMIGVFSSDNKSRLASLDKVAGSKIYFRQEIGRHYPPTFMLRFYFCPGNRKVEGPILGPYATQEWFTRKALPKFAVEIARLHAPDIFS